MVLLKKKALPCFTEGSVCSFSVFFLEGGGGTVVFHDLFVTDRFCLNKGSFLLKYILDYLPWSQANMPVNDYNKIAGIPAPRRRAMGMGRVRNRYLRLKGPVQYLKPHHTSSCLFWDNSDHKIRDSGT